MWPNGYLTIILESLLLLSTLSHHATSTVINPSLAPSSNAIIAACFTPEIRTVSETNMQDCRNALTVLARAPDFTTPKTYSKNPRREALSIPKGWVAGDCLIMVSCDNDRDAYTFRLADVLAVAKKIVDNCVATRVSPKWGLLRWGGIDVLGNSLTFYVSVFKPLRDSTGKAISLELVNDTLLDTAMKYSRGMRR